MVPTRRLICRSGNKRLCPRARVRVGVACQSTLLPSAAPPIRCAIIVGTRPEQSPSPPTESVRGGPSARIETRNSARSSSHARRPLRGVRRNVGLAAQPMNAATESGNRELFARTRPGFLSSATRSKAASPEPSFAHVRLVSSWANGPGRGHAGGWSRKLFPDRRFRGFPLARYPGISPSS
jgi:hypothetical protein